MENLKLIDPTNNLETEYLDMIYEWKKSGEELIPWSLTLNLCNFNIVVKTLNGYRKAINLPEGFIECSTYWLVDNNNNKILGVIDIRHGLNEDLLFRGGHIGYGIRPSERKKGYSTLMLSLALKKCKAIGLSDVLITCLKNNTGSVKTITNNKGILESEDIDKDGVFQRYWINLK